MTAPLTYRGVWLTGALAGAAGMAVIAGVQVGRVELALGALALLAYALVCTVREWRIWRAAVDGLQALMSLHSERQGPARGRAA